MKALKLSSIALCVFALVSSCTKDSLETSTASSSSLQSVLGANGRGQAEAQATKVEATPTISYTITPSEVAQGVNSTLAGTITFSEAVKQFNYKIEVAPQVGTQADGVTPVWGTWTATGFGDNIKLSDNEAAISSFPFTHVINTTNMAFGLYGYKIHVAGADIKGENAFSQIKTLRVKPVCSGLSIIGALVGTPEAGIDGRYTFTVKYKVNTCTLAYNMLKTQGGLTNGIELVGSYSKERTPGQSTNKIITWIEGEKGGVQLTGTDYEYTIVFKKAWDGVSEIELTGDWSVSASLLNGEEVKDEFPKIYYKP